jgi:hypothetical protein
VLPAVAPLEVPRWRLIGLLLVAGVALRLLHGNEPGSDVLAVTQSAISYATHGENPYGHGYLTSRPPGAPFAYGPLALLWYAVTPRNIELLASIAVLLLLASTRRVIGLAICALWIPMAILANDGSNDSSAGLLLLGALVLAERSPRLGAVALAGVVAFKPYALAFLPALMAFGGAGVVLPFLAASGLLWGPAIWLWGAGNILTSFRMSMEVHVLPWASLAAAFQLDARYRGILGIVQVASGLAVSLAGLRSARSARAMVAWGIAIFAATLYTGWWSTVAYLAAVLPISAWHVDAWFHEVRSAADPGRHAAPGRS